MKYLVETSYHSRILCRKKEKTTWTAILISLWGAIISAFLQFTLKVQEYIFKNAFAFVKNMFTYLCLWIQP